ncbi:hypothetical protein ACHAWF_008238 [Thalassiosira exigua]
MATIDDGDSRRRPRSSSARLLPPVFPGQSLSHNLHELVLGVLINSDGQNVLSKQRLTSTSSHDLPRSLAPSESSIRKVIKVERFERIPTWPARNGLRFRAVTRFNPDLAARLEHRYGGASCPNLWLSVAKQTSPFLMMCHHNHSFDSNDPARVLERRFAPEGFPSHAHRGLTTLTICIRGGMVHRDSLGNKQVFGADEDEKNGRFASNKPYGGKHTQWLTFGKGIVHELMWDNEPSKKGQFGRRGDGGVIHQEIYQIWIDLPRKERYTEPRVELLGGGDETPAVIDMDGTRTTVFAGEHDGASASVDTISDLAVVLEIDGPGRTWTHRPPLSHSTIIIYVRTGSVRVGNARIPAHSTAYLSPAGDLCVRSEEDGADFLVMAGEPLGQGLAARGSMVGETREELDRAFRDYQRGDMGVPWSESCSDEEWKKHLAKTRK